MQGRLGHEETDAIRFARGGAVKFKDEMPDRGGYYWARWEYADYSVCDPFPVMIRGGEVYTVASECPIATEVGPEKLLFGDAVEFPEVDP